MVVTFVCLQTCIRRTTIRDDHGVVRILDDRTVRECFRTCAMPCTALTHGGCVPVSRITGSDARITRCRHCKYLEVWPSCKSQVILRQLLTVSASVIASYCVLARDQAQGSGSVRPKCGQQTASFHSYVTWVLGALLYVLLLHEPVQPAETIRSLKTSVLFRLVQNANHSPPQLYDFEKELNLKRQVDHPDWWSGSVLAAKTAVDDPMSPAIAEIRQDVHWRLTRTRS